MFDMLAKFSNLATEFNLLGKTLAGVVIRLVNPFGVGGCKH